MKTSTKLSIIYLCTTFLSLFMVIVIFVFPASPFVNSSEDSEYQRAVRKFDTSPNTPPNLVTKYESHTLVHFTHIFPSGIWALMIPFQFHPRMRKVFPKLHRLSGRIFAYCSYLSIIGLGVIFFKGLSYENHLHPSSVRGRVLIHINANVMKRFQPLLLSPSILFVNSAALPFLYTITKAIKYVKKKDYTNHQIWMVRHVSWGIWVALLRIFLGCMVGLYETFVGMERDAPDHVKGRTFFYCGAVAAITSVTVGEYTVSLLRLQLRLRQGQQGRTEIYRYKQKQQ